ncbi:hypothetical protein [Vallicoccus soli]|uniref:Uncharacterized protein n=1 Tax=Vallicoccus soli TaxID=2339232 RepID=A0A3A3YNB6_9ACTN|nr:hypothetical protein [Vallicoccus soli]RJK92628.1 hypothetical protein D5H78_18500 [Vallicoccus soli]
MSTASGGPGRRGEGDYADKDVPGGDVEPGEGQYTDQETPREARGEEPDLRGPDDDGAYTDRDVAGEHRAAPREGSYVQKDTPSTPSTPTDDAGENEHG